MRTNKTLRIASVLLIAVLMTTCIIGGTFAKYTSNLAVTATQGIATWNVTLDATDEDSATEGIQINLADTVLDTNGDATETDVKSGLIAPGTKGSFKIAIKNASQVKANAVLTLTVPTLPTGMTLKNGATALAAGERTITVSLDMEQSTATEVEFTWEWVYDTDTAGENDTNDLTFQGQTLSIPVAIAVTQVD